MRAATARVIGAGLLGLSLAAAAGGPLSVCNQVPMKYPGTGTIRLNYDQGPLGTRSKAQADALVTAAIANWTNVSTATVDVSRGTDVNVDVTSSNYSTYIGGNSYSDGLNPVVYDTNGSIIDLLLGSGAKSDVLGFAGSAWTTGTTCTYREGRAVINGAISVSDMSMRVVLAHEIGHLIGLDHAQIDGEQGLAAANYPLMYPIAYRSTDALHEDDVAAVSALYPDTSLNTVYGQLSGTFTLATGVAIRGANIWARETSTGKVYSAVSDYLEQGTGYFRLHLPAGIYQLRAGGIRTTFNGGSSVGPYAETSAGLSFLAPMYTGATRMTAIALGGASPTAITIVPGCSATATFRFDGGGSVSGNCASVPPVALTVFRGGSGSGTVTSAPAGISCGSTCSATFASGTAVTLSAAAAAGSTFAGWSGACNGTGACAVTMSAARSVTATFNAATTPTATLVTRYRLYSPGTFEHLYTTDLNEYGVLPGCCGWVPEGAIYRILGGPGTFNGVAGVPYFRLYNPFSHQHHWTTDTNEYGVLPSAGWMQEGIDGYVLPTRASGSVPLYRLYLNAQGGLHLWTIDAFEVNHLTTQAGWVSEGIAGYVVPLSY